MSQHSDTTVLGFLLGHLAPAFDFSNVSIIALTSAWWEKEPHPMTEIGVAELPLPVLPFEGYGDMLFSHIDSLLLRLNSTHARIKPNAHLVNHFPGAGNVEKFNFGHTVFTDVGEARQGLFDIIVRPYEDGTLRPVVLLGHAVHNHMDRLKTALGIDLLSLGCIVRVLDTQEMAKDRHIVAPVAGAKENMPISLKHLVQHYKVMPNNLRTAGNDVVHIVLAAIITTLETELYVNDDDGDKDTYKERLNALLNRMMQMGKMKPPQNWGSPVFCTRCDRTNHFRDECRANYIVCAICSASPSAKNRAGARTHQTNKCLFAPIPVPNTTGAVAATMTGKTGSTAVGPRPGRATMK
ncbi:hypothetical protein K504DRAFT_370187 [Pleomassaria siparia CBS 279.74]|uniref:Gfd2/YDR514C-like C-terminal domain-containing protein n=1 Tax=Pleomassaria siparia CBS 279.74 TaxID=1314801 RepID=A0A6G1KLT0_9PLEO|nr:hypothetical protein K504DRAFT_370187 [Pleomassaria siparia CBS 279.74]